MVDSAGRKLMMAAAAAARLYWQGRQRCVVLDTDFQQGQKFIQLWRAFRDDREDRQDRKEHEIPAPDQRLHVIAMLPVAPKREDLICTAHPADDSPLRRLLVDAWPMPTPGFHTLSFDNDHVQLLLCNGNATRQLSELVAQINVFLVHGRLLSNSGGADPSRMVKALARLAAEGAVLVADTAVTSQSSGDGAAFQEALRSQGFVIEPNTPGVTNNNATTNARFAPRFQPKRAAARVHGQPSTARHALIVGAGLAGSSAAWALAAQGWTSTVFERHANAAQEASGNAAGLFHGVIHAGDGIHARFNRAASIEAAKAVRFAVAHHGAGGSADGLLRLEADLSVDAMQAVLDNCRLPASYAQAVGAAEASRLSQLNLQQNAWFYCDGGWVQPAALARSFLQRAGQQSQLRCDCEVEGLRRSNRGWQLLNAQGQILEEAEVVVLANALQAARLLASVSPQTLSTLQNVRGQISQLPSSTAGLPSTRLPLTGAGYLLPSWQGHTLFGATSQPDDDDPGVRADDHQINLAQLAKLTQKPSVLSIATDAAQGRTAWRCVAPDRLPVIGGVPQETHKLIDQPRLIPRWPGLFVYTALGSRGITWSALGAQVLTAWVTGCPSPVEASLLDALDPARFAARRARAQSKL